MSDPAPAKPAAAVKPQTAPLPDPPQQTTRVVDDSGHYERHGREGWIERSSWFNARHARHALAGALYDVGPDDALTQTEVQKRLDKFLSRGGKS